MCGITGMFSSHEPANEEILKKMNRTLTRRGPDDEGYYTEGSLGLAMRRLKIIDLEGGHQPISNEDGTVWTVFNGEIYNFQDLRKKLIRKGHHFRSKTDSEVIVHLYEEKGESFVEDLRGMFAIALWDKLEQKLLLYRDRIGIKPLHYYYENGLFLFGSEIKALNAHPGIQKSLSLPALDDYLAFLYVPAPHSIYREIHKIPPAHFLRFQNNHYQIEPYWDFAFEADYYADEEDWCERIRDTLDESVRMHLVSDVPVGAFLSGGIDSSTVCAFAAKNSTKRLKTYAMGFEDQRHNELPYARLAAAHFGSDHHEKIVQPKALELLPEILPGFDEPFADSSAIPTYLVSQFARQDVTVALSGDGGDELFGGYLWTQKELWLDQYRQLPRWLRKTLVTMLINRDFQPLRERGPLSGLKRFVFDAGQTPVDSFSRRAMCFQPWMRSKLFQPWVLDELRRNRRKNAFKYYYQKTYFQERIDKLFYLDAKVYLPDDLLTKVDRMSMLHSLEVRVPLLDYKVAELACSIPPTFKFRNKTTKYILKQAVRDFLPAKLLKQRKQGFSIPIQRWFRQELYETAQRILITEADDQRAYFRKDYIRWMLDEHRAGRQLFGTQIYALIAFELWCREKN
ncbi:MAG: asparagine synthase (glutamine-hydrolyzing) [Candidatus Omnitrophica bacterium]|nr:asparagine synthase (glutamine-hydrolyzing) [Candidatus Omnitrophota bacterium]